MSQKTVVIERRNAHHKRRNPRMSLSNEELRKNLKTLGINPQGDRKGMSKQLKEYLKNPRTEMSSAAHRSSHDDGQIPKASTPDPEATPEKKDTTPPKPIYKVSLPPSASATTSQAHEASSSRSTEYGQPVSNPLPLSEKARGKLPEYMRTEETKQRLPDDFDIWEEIEPHMSSGDASECEFDGFISPEEETVFQERFAKISEMYETNKRAGIAYGDTTRIAYAEGIEIWDIQIPDSDMACSLYGSKPLWYDHLY